MNLLIVNLFVVLIEAALLLQNNNYIQRKRYLILIFVQLFILHAFLDPYKMVDLPGYIETFELFSTNSLKYSFLQGYVGVKMEPGWIVLCKALSYIADDYRILLIFTSMIIVGAHCVTIFRHSKFVWLSVFIWLCTNFDQSLFVLRQHTAMAICMMSIPLIVDRKFKHFVLVILLALSMHSTAIIFTPMYFLYWIKLNNKTLLILALATLVLSSLSAQFFSWLFANTWYNSYEDQDASNYTGFFIALCSFLLYGFSRRWNFDNISGAEKVFFLMSCICVSLAFVGVGFSPTNRLERYFSIASIFTIPYSLSYIKEKLIRNSICVVVLVFYSKLFFSTSNLQFIKEYTLTIFE